MAIPAELTYSSEQDFIRQFLVPLLLRLGFGVVENHGPREFGRDIIYAEFDRFGDVRYHGLQAKYVSSISKSNSHGLVEDCDEAFTHKFQHPKNGESHYISTFIVANGGEISDTATEYFFAKLHPKYGANVKLLDGKALIALDHFASFSRRENIGSTLTGLILEVRYNRIRTNQIFPMLHDWLADQSKAFPLYRVRHAATMDFLAHPPVVQGMDLHRHVARYAAQCEKLHQVLEYLSYATCPLEQAKILVDDIVESSTEFYLLGNQIEEIATEIISKLGPISGM